MTVPREKLIAARKEMGLTQEQLAEKVGINRAYLANIENGKNTPSLEVAKNISAALSLSINDLF
ncbi:XRE family transcriptional regulator [Neobacillus notoginsengisoli]|uniref:XRE family transcriptional regulator n=1 Tax=Neobacillus notoginsengisoli TaxID=1578198 RepID=A0A417YRI9_9BACI|nr:helix-turn-helix transcriptional regulator [Neobacillus notoginsengisoli]RHW37290.1 XRE family transcriptional regulator [Neobacillus notoginsengisoli]